MCKSESPAAVAFSTQDRTVTAGKSSQGFPWQRNITPPGVGNGQAWNWGRRATFSFWSPQGLQVEEAGEVSEPPDTLKMSELGNKEPGPSGTPGLKQRCPGVMEKVTSIHLCPDPHRQRPLQPLGPSLMRIGPGCLGQGYSRKSWVFQRGMRVHHLACWKRCDCPPFGIPSWWSETYGFYKSRPWSQPFKSL